MTLMGYLRANYTDEELDELLRTVKVETEAQRPVLDRFRQKYPRMTERQTLFSMSAGELEQMRDRLQTNILLKSSGYKVHAGEVSKEASEEGCIEA
jgi:hypothetical protein